MMTEEQKQALIARCNYLIGGAPEIDVQLAEFALAALTQPASPALKLPDGWVAVPVEPNWEMLSADGCKEHHNGQTCLHHDNRRRIWAAMLSAAPTPHTAPIEPICATGGAEAVQLPDLNDDLIDILGRPNFTCSSIAQILRMGGRDIPRKSENEQAAAIHFLLNHYLADNEKWLQAAGADLKAMGVRYE